MTNIEPNKTNTGEIRDELPEDLNKVDSTMAYDFPDNSRRRTPGAIYGVLAVMCFGSWLLARNTDSALMNRGVVVAGIILGVVSILNLTSGWKMTITESDALVNATRVVGFPVGHASAQQVWRGIRSRPTWRIFCYSIEEPPMKRGLVLVDAVNGSIVETLIEDNPEDDGPIDA